MKIRQSSLKLLPCLLIAILGCSEPAPVTQEATDSVPAMEAQKAVAGVGKKGQSLKGNTGIARVIAGPAVALMNFEQKAVLEFQIPPAIQMFKASTGRFPKDHAEFMEKIVDANRLKLPELPEGAVYRFNSEKGELWVYPENEIPSP